MVHASRIYYSNQEVNETRLPDTGSSRLWAFHGKKGGKNEISPHSKHTTETARRPRPTLTACN